MISTGMLWNPARMISTKNGVHCQTMRMMIVSREWTPKKSKGRTPRSRAKYSFQPKEELRMIVRQMMPATASMTKNGEMMSVRTTFTPGKLVVQHEAEEDPQHRAGGEGHDGDEGRVAGPPRRSPGR